MCVCLYVCCVCVCVVVRVCDCVRACLTLLSRWLLCWLLQAADLLASVEDILSAMNAEKLHAFVDAVSESFLLEDLEHMPAADVGKFLLKFKVPGATCIRVKNAVTAKVSGVCTCLCVYAFVSVCVFVCVCMCVCVTCSCESK